MASPPRATSPPGANPLALPRQRPRLALPGHKSRKPSVASTTASTPSAHPLSQMYVPDPDSLEAQHAAAEDAALRFSPSQASNASLEDEFSDSEMASAMDDVGGEDSRSGTKKRKRGEKKPRGRPARHASGHVRTGSVSVVNGEGSKSADGDAEAGEGGGGGDEADDEGEDGEDEARGGGRVPLYEGGQMSQAETDAETEQKAKFRLYMEHLDRLPLTHPSRKGMTTHDMTERYDVSGRAKLQKNDVRRLVNQTLSQSVPHNVVTVVSAYTKTFAAMLIEEAREVQREWMAVEAQRADGKENAAFERLKKAQSMATGGGGEVDEQENSAPKPPGSASSEERTIKQESSSPTQADTQTQTQTLTQPTDTSTIPSLYPGGAGGLQTSFEECDRGPLLPDHLREALRRYKKRRNGAVGFTGLSMEGKENAASRMGGRRLFK